MSTEAGATRRRGKDGLAANGSSENLVDGVKVGAGSSHGILQFCELIVFLANCSHLYFKNIDSSPDEL